jgi:hypothetical protein
MAHAMPTAEKNGSGWLLRRCAIRAAEVLGRLAARLAFVLVVAVERLLH